MEYKKKYWWGRIFALIGVSYICLTTILSVRSSSSSTASLNYLFLPLFALIFGIIFGFAGYCLSKVLQFKDSKPFLACLLIIPAVGIPGYFLYTELINTYLCGRTTYLRNLSANELATLMQNPPTNQFELAAITENPYVTDWMLDKIARINDPDLYEKQGTSWACIKGENRKGLAVMRLVALNPNVSAITLEYLAANTNNDYVLADIIRNPKISDDTLRRVYNQFKNNIYSMIDWGIAQNPNAPIDILTEIWNSTTNQYTRESIQSNPKFPQIQQK